MSARRPPQEPPTPQPAPVSRFDVAVSIVVSGTIVLELKSTSSGGATPEQLDELAAKLKASGSKVNAVLDANPPINP